MPMLRFVIAGVLLCMLLACSAALPPLPPVEPVAQAAVPLAGLSITIVADARLDSDQSSLSAALLHAGFRVVPRPTPHHLELRVSGEGELGDYVGGVISGLRGSGCYSAYSAKVLGRGGELVAVLRGK